MPEPILYGPPSETLFQLLQPTDFASPEQVFGHLSARLAVTHLSNIPHSIAEIVAHMHHNMVFNLGLIERTVPPSSPDWPTVTESEWLPLVHDFFEVLTSLLRYTKSPTVLNQVIFPATAAEPAWTAGYKLAVNVAQHNAYHLGQIVILRQLLGIWPDEEVTEHSR